ncbi:MAG TPA: hypothetical protein VFN27_16870, partial [Xanthobacteraceae bacterium]|nr:hypothetical protein [Xanthobacteraceae bacterium]
LSHTAATRPVCRILRTRLSAFRLRLFSFFPFVIAGLDPAIHAEAFARTALPPAFGRIAATWTTGSSPVVTGFDRGVA